MKKEIIFLTFREFYREGGGSLRIKGMLNALVEAKQNITIFANAKPHDFSEKVNIIPLEMIFTDKERQVFLFLMGLFPIFIVKLFLYKKLKNLELFCIQHNLQNKQIIFSEYLDNAIGYYLQKQRLIGSCINDIHGMAVNEFKYKKSYSLQENIINKIKYIIAIKLDKKVFNFVDGFIFASKGMQNYFYKQYPNIKNKNNTIVPYLLGDSAVKQTVDEVLKIKIIQKYKLTKKEKIIFFAGAFKDIGGVLDLVDSFIQVTKQKNDIKLFLIGMGENIEIIKEKIKINHLKDKVILAGTIDYKDLRTYQDIADIIVCPDRQNIFSNFIFHLKYLDSLMSNKIVINGNFKSVLEINKNEKLSINFEPSDTDSLAEKIMYSLDNLEDLNQKYKNNRNSTSKFFTYNNYIADLVKNTNFYGNVNE